MKREKALHLFVSALTVACGVRESCPRPREEVGMASICCAAAFSVGSSSNIDGIPSGRLRQKEGMAGKGSGERT